MKTEKVSINLNPTELGQIDYLVEKGIYDSRSDFIRMATRKSLEHYAPDFQKFIDRAEGLWGDPPEVARHIIIGVSSISKSDITRLIAHGKRINISVIGLLKIAADITRDDVMDAVLSCKVYGKLVASDEVKEAIREIEAREN